MNSYTMKELTAQTKMVCDAACGTNPVLITYNGKPSKLIIDVEDLDLEQQLKLLRQTRMAATVESMRRQALGVDMSMDEIDAMIADARRQRHSG